MGRMTRKKAAEVAEQLHIDENDLLELPQDDGAAMAKGAKQEPADRAPLGELAANSADGSNASDDGLQELRKSVRSKKGGKKGGAKGKKNNLGASTASRSDVANEDDDDDDEQEVLPDENDSAPSLASEKVAEDLMKDGPELSIQDTAIIQPESSPGEAVKLTTGHQLQENAGSEQADSKTSVGGTGEEAVETMKEERLRDTPAIEPSESVDVDETSSQAMPQDMTAMDAPASPPATAVPAVISKLRADTPAKRSTSNKENVEPNAMTSTPHSNYDELEHAVVASATPEPSSRRSSSRPEENIIALDDLNDAVETIDQDVPEVQPSSEKSKPKEAVKREKKAPVVRTNKAAAARLSMSQNASGRAPTLGRPRPSTTLGRANSVRETGTAKPRVASSSSSKDEKPGTANGEKKEADIPHSKRRPISLSFPAPPPPPKSTKAPTQSTFQLPGEAVAAKLKAAREARAQREAEEAKKKVFKARPVPASLKNAHSVRQTNASNARQSVMNGKDLKASTSGLQRANSVATAKPRAPAVSKETRKPSVTGTTTAASHKRPSTAMASMTKPRESLSTSQRAAAYGPSNNAAKGSNKGKEVFNRAANATAAANKEKHEREEAAKKARAEAAERSKQLAREFAEKQRLKKMAASKSKEHQQSEVAVESPPTETATTA